MNIYDLFENSGMTDFEQEQEHFDALDRTGFYGDAGAGCIFIARSTGRILLCHRSEHVEQPGTWGNWGGAINRGENPDDAVEREAIEETGHPGPFELIPLYIFSKGTFKYYNYLVMVDDEFSPTLDWESQGYKWVKWGEWPSPLHFGLQALFSDAQSVRKIMNVLESLKN